MTTLHADPPTTTTLPPRGHHPPLAVVALIFGIAGVTLLLPLVGPLVAFAFAGRARAQVRRDPGRYRMVLPQVAVTLGWLGLATAALAGIVLLGVAGVV